MLRTSARLKDQAGVSHGAQDHKDDDPARAPSPNFDLPSIYLSEHQATAALSLQSGFRPVLLPDVTL